MNNQPTSITDDEIRSVLYRMAAHVSFFAEPRTPEPKAAAFADALMSAVRPPELCVTYLPPGDRFIPHLIEALNKLHSDGFQYVPENWTVNQIFEEAI